MIGAESTTKVTVSTESAPTPLVAVMVKGYVPVVVGIQKALSFGRWMSRSRSLRFP